VTKLATVRRALMGAFWLMAGTGLARIMPIFIGMAFAHQYDLVTYAAYVAFVIGCNLVSAVPLMGATQLMLSESGYANAPTLLSQYLRSLLWMQLISWGLVALATWGLSSAALSSGMHVNAWTVASLYVLSLGYCLTGVAAAAFNKTSQRGRAGACWILSTTTSGLTGLAGVLLKAPADQAVAFLAAGWLIGGWFCLRWVYRTGPVLASQMPVTHQLPEWRNIIVFGAPSVVFLLGFYLLTQKAQQSHQPQLQGAFSLGYQLFSAALFLPGVLGNITTPRLVRLQPYPALHKRFILQLLLAYAAVAAVWGGGFISPCLGCCLRSKFPLPMALKPWCCCCKRLPLLPFSKHCGTN